MNFFQALVNGDVAGFKSLVLEGLQEIAERKMQSFKRLVAADYFDELAEEMLPEANVIKMGRTKLTRIRVRRRNGRITVQRRIRRSSVKGWVLRGGKGLAHTGAKLTRITTRQKMKMKLAARRGARKRRGKMQLIKRRRILSMNKRRTLGLR